MEVHHHIVKRAPHAPEQSVDGRRKSDVAILDARLWQTPETRQPASEPRPEATGVEVSLLPQTRRLLRKFPVPGLEQPFLRHLEQRIARNPRDLVSHVRRIYLAHALEDTESIVGALADLFLVLSHHGLPLRRRLIRLVRTQLTPNQLEFFRTHLEHGLDASAPIADMPRSRLSKQLQGTTRIVSRLDDGTDDPAGAVLLARDSRARGRYDLAQAVLEGALETDPGNSEVSEELLDLYSDRDLRSSFRRTYTALLGRQLACRDRWDEFAGSIQLRDGEDG